MKKAEWFENWFDSPYYHLLYSHRNYDEAERFIDNLCNYLKLKPGATIWDLACGKGRHSLALNKKGYKVTGTDLSENSIKEASKNKNGSLEFLVHDMRSAFRENEFDAVLNLFTSIGYFSDFEDNYRVFKNIAKALKPGGRLVVDFFNPEKVRKALAVEQLEKRAHITFEIRKEVIGKAVVKNIQFHDQGKDYVFEERVNLLSHDDFNSFAEKAGLQLGEIFGNYNLDPWNAESSDRMILFFNKPAK